jgi:hypothetical protein
MPVGWSSGVGAGMGEVVRVMERVLGLDLDRRAD